MFIVVIIKKVGEVDVNARCWMHSVYGAVVRRSPHRTASHSINKHIALIINFSTQPN